MSFHNDKNSIYQEDIISVNLHAPNNMLLKRYKGKNKKVEPDETDKSTIIEGDFKIFLSIIARTSRQKTVSKNAEDLMINKPDLVDIYRTTA